jgi:hypothetical protein
MVSFATSLTTNRCSPRLVAWLSRLLQVDVVRERANPIRAKPGLHHAAACEEIIVQIGHIF